MSQAETSPRLDVSAGPVPFAPGLPIITTGRLDEAYASTLAHLLDHGAAVRAGTSQSVGQGRLVKELLNFTVYLPDATDRLLANRHRPLNVIGAVGRFLWMMAGSSRLADIAYYEPRVRAFSDDGLSVPGSCYGARLLCPRPGLNQLTNAIEVLRQDPTSRRAAATIYHPEDAGRDSRDIPCAFGVFWTVRDETLITSVIMRSNNAWTLLPYNVFEFTLLSELVAAELRLDLGSYSHHAFSMHLYEGDVDAAREAIGGVPPGPLSGMEKIPRGPALDDLHRVLLFEQELRQASSGLNARSYAKWERRATELGPFWVDLGLILVAHAAQRADREGIRDTVAARVSGPLGHLLRTQFGCSEDREEPLQPQSAEPQTLAVDDTPGLSDVEREQLDAETRKFYIDLSRQELAAARERAEAARRQR